MLNVLRDRKPHQSREIADRAGVTTRYVRASWPILGRHGYRVKRLADYRHQLVAEPTDDGTCIECGAYLRRGNIGPWCAPCECRLEPTCRDEEPEVYDPNEDPNFLDRLHEALVDAAKTGEDDGWVNVYEFFHLDGIIWSRWVSRKVDELRKRGCVIHGRLHGGFRIEGCEIETDTLEDVDRQLSNLLGGIVEPTT